MPNDRPRVATGADPAGVALRMLADGAGAAPRGWWRAARADVVDLPEGEAPADRVAAELRRAETCDPSDESILHRLNPEPAASNTADSRSSDGSNSAFPPGVAAAADGGKIPVSRQKF